LDEALLKSEWNHVKVTYKDSIMKSLLKESRMHILKQESSMEDIKFINLYEKRKLDVKMMFFMMLMMFLMVMMTIH
jgi:hypothetical protein